MRIVSESRRPVRSKARPRGATPHPWSEGGDAAPLLYLAADVAAEVDKRCAESAKSERETLGLLVGDFFTDRAGALFAVAGAVVSSPQDSTRTHVRFTAARFGELARQLEGLPFDPLMVGWFHTHLGIGATMSPTDHATQERYFGAPHQTTWVLDPVRREACGFVQASKGPAPAAVSVLDTARDNLRDFLAPKRAASPRTRTTNTSR